MLLKLLDEDEVRRIVLFGESGIGKTWTAREISNLARKRGLIDIVLWVYMNRKNDSDTLRDSLAYQLSLSTTGGSEVEGDNEQLEKEESQGDSQQEMSRVVDGKKLLLVLDDEGNKMNEQEVMSALETLLNLNQQNYKVLITKRDILSSDISEDDENSRIEVKPMSKEESLSLLRGRVGTEAFEVQETAALAEKFVEKTKNVPAAIILMAKAFSYFVHQDSGIHILERSLEEASENYSITDLLRSGYDLLPNSILFDCCWGGSHFLHHCGRIYYNGLIAYWIMEGYLGHAGLMEKAYERGHFVLMELIDCQILKRVEPDYVIMEGPTLNLVDVVMERARVNKDDCYRHGFCGTASLGLGNVFGDGKWEGLGRVTKKDGVIKTLRNGKQGNKMSTLLLDGSSLTREFPCDFLESHQDLQVVGVFSPTLNTLPPSSSMVHNLYMFVLRGCHFMEKIEQMVNFQKLTVLEISGPSFLTTIPDEFFKNIPRLQSLNLSFLQINDLPSSLYDLSELRWLILRGCSRLKSLQSLKKCKNLAVLDLSGATSLEKILDKNFLQNQELQMLNFSKTKIKCIPLVNSLKKLTHLLLSRCLELERLRGINGVTSLQVLDLSNASKFNEFHDQSLDGIVGFKILDLSGTAIDHLPSKIGNPLHLFLRGCTRLEDLSCLETLKDLELIDISKLQLKTLPSLSHLHNLRSLSVTCSNLVKLPDLSDLKLLEVLDLSGCSDLEVLQDDTFEHMPCLWKLDLSEIRINCSLSSLSQLTNLRHLLLNRCTGLTALPPLGALSKLEELSLCGISCLRDTEADFLEKMSHLQILDLSETLLQKLPRMVNLKNLRQLYLRGCPGLKTVPDLETLTKLEVLDLSGTAVCPSESLHDFINLRQFLPGDFLVPKEILRPENDPSDGAAQELPHGVSEWAQLEKRDLPNIIEGQDQCGWRICSLPSGTVGKITIVLYLRAAPSFSNF